MKYAALLLVALATVPARAANQLSLEEAIRIAVQDNPEIKAARKRWEAARARIAQEATPEKPRVDFERMYGPKNKDVISGAEEKNIAISQEVPFPTTLYLKGKKASQEARMKEAAYHAKELDVLARVRTAYAMLYLSHHAIHIFEENVDLMRRFARAAEAKYAAGKVPQADALKAQVELSKMLNELVTLEQERETNRAMLNTLLNRTASEPLEIVEIKPALFSESLEQLESMALASRPDLKEASAALESSQTGVALGRSDYLPDVMLQYRRRDMRMGVDSHDAMLGLTVPLYFWKQSAMVREAKADRDMAWAEYDAMKNMTLFDVKNLSVKAKTAFRMIELYHTSVLPQSEQALRVAEAGYRADKINFLELLDAVRSYLNFRLEHYEHIAAYEQFRAELERVVGTNLTDLKEKLK